MHGETVKFTLFELIQKFFFFYVTRIS